MFRPTLVVLGALLFVAPASAAEFNEQQRSEIEKILRETLMKNPEIIKEVIQSLQEREAVAKAEGERTAITSNADALFRSPRQAVLGNPEGKVTLVEFFDYNCGFCKRALIDMQKLIAEDGDLKVVLKEFPILSAGSIDAARVSVAALRADKSKYANFHSLLLSEKGQADKAKALAAAGKAGFDVAALEKNLEDPEVIATIEEAHRLASALGITGTPSYIINDQVIPGAVGTEKLKSEIETARNKAGQGDK